MNVSLESAVSRIKRKAADSGSLENSSKSMYGKKPDEMEVEQVSSLKKGKVAATKQRSTIFSIQEAKAIHHLM